MDKTKPEKQPHAHYPPYVPSPLAEPRSVETPTALKVGSLHLTRNELGQLCISDKVRGTVVDEKTFETLIRGILDNRWRA